jgi:CYTH domain-containing protein
MAVEIERKFLTKDSTWKQGAEGAPYRQGYLSREKGRTVRVRLAGAKAWITIKGPSDGCSRPEFEYPIPADDAAELFQLCDGPLVEKTRHRIPFGGLVWEVDEFHGENEGLVVAEVELTSPDQEVPLPPWIGREVTGDRRYDNSSLSIRPYSGWEREDSVSES